MKIKFFLFFIIALKSFSQEIKGVVKDEFGNPLSLINVQLINKQDDFLLEFVKTNAKGEFFFKTPPKSNTYNLKFSHFKFENLILEVKNKFFFEVVLQSKINVIEDVVVKGKTADIIEKKDTLKYNLNNLLSGSESNLKDIIKKLPGLSINSSGKILFNSIPVDNFLIGGDSFFKDNQQIATENLTPEMIETIEILKNYQDISSLKGFEKNGVAINIGLKKSFKDIIKGNISLEGGFDTRYNLHNNNYFFGAKNKFHLLSNLNNTDYNVFNFSNFLEMREINGKSLLKEKLDIGFERETIKDIPPFFFANDNVVSKNSKNITLNYSNKIDNKKRLEIISILNNLNQLQNTNSLQTFWGNINTNISRNINSDDESSFIFNKVKFENKFNENNFLQSNFYFISALDIQNQEVLNNIENIQQINNFNNNLKINNLNTGINLFHRNKISNNLLLENAIYTDLNFSKNFKKFSSNEPFDWFNLNENQVNQKTTYESLNFGIFSHLTLKVKKSIFNLKYIFSIEPESLSNQNNISELFNFTQNFSRFSNSFKLNYSSSSENKIKINAGFEYQLNYLKNTNRSSKYLNSLLPYFNLSFKLLKNTNILSGFSKKLNIPSIYNFQIGNIVDNFRAITTASNLPFENIITNNYNLGFNYYNTSKTFFSNLNFSYSKNDLALGNLILNDFQITQNSFGFFRNSDVFFSSIYFNRKFKKVPFGINLDASYSKSNIFSLNNNQLNRNLIEQKNIDLGVVSYFKNFVNFNFGIKGTEASNESLSLSRNKLVNLNPYLNIEKSLFKNKLNFKFNSTYFIFQSTAFKSNNIFDFGFKVNYKASTKLEYFINSNNILNINNEFTKNTFISNETFVEQTFVNSLNGFINFGLKFSY